MKSSIFGSKGPVIFIDHSVQGICFVCNKKALVVSIESALPMFEPLEGRPKVHFCYSCAGTVSTSIGSLLFDLVPTQR